MEKFEVLMLGFMFGIVVGYLIKHCSIPLSKEEYKEREIACEESYRHQLQKVQELEALEKRVNRIIKT